MDGREAVFINIYLKVCIFLMCPLAGMDVPDRAVRPEGEAVEFSPDIVRPYPKAGPRKITKRRGRKRQVELLLHLVWTSFVYSHVDLPHLK